MSVSETNRSFRHRGTAVHGIHNGVVNFGKKISKVLDELQKGLDGWMTKYNLGLFQEGKRCKGTHPYDLFLKICPWKKEIVGYGRQQSPDSLNKIG